jgi:hypothetical protein
MEERTVFPRRRFAPPRVCSLLAYFFGPVTSMTRHCSWSPRLRIAQPGCFEIVLVARGCVYQGQQLPDDDTLVLCSLLLAAGHETTAIF